MVTWDSWHKVNVGSVRLVPTSEPSETLEDAVARIKMLGLNLYGPVVVNIYSDQNCFKPRAVLSTARPRKRMKTDPLSGLTIARNKTDKRFYLYFQKEYTEREIVCLEYRDNLLRVDFKEPEIFRDMESAFSYARERGFVFYDAIIVENARHFTPNQLSATALLTRSVELVNVTSDSENALITRDDTLVTKPSFRLYIPGQFKVLSYEPAEIYRPILL